jgi:hypothetical protein
MRQGEIASSRSVIGRSTVASTRALSRCVYVPGRGAGSLLKTRHNGGMLQILVAQLLPRVAFVLFGSTLSSFLCYVDLPTDV